jgi:glutamate synthase domain-containing protein 2
LVGLNIRDRVKLGASGKIITAFDMARMMALGADWCNAARGFMFALGCIQAQKCDTDRCPTGVATQDRIRQRALVVSDKAERVFHFHQATVMALAELIAAAGLEHPDQISPRHFLKRVAPDRVASFDQIYRFLKPGEMLTGTDDPRFQHLWPTARASSFTLAA